jgi:hypothetical protein
MENAVRVRVTIGADHTVRLPDEIPAGLESLCSGSSVTSRAVVRQWGRSLVRRSRSRRDVEALTTWYGNVPQHEEHDEQGSVQEHDRASNP